MAEHPSRYATRAELEAHIRHLQTTELQSAEAALEIAQARIAAAREQLEAPVRIDLLAARERERNRHVDGAPATDGAPVEQLELPLPRRT